MESLTRQQLTDLVTCVRLGMQHGTFTTRDAADALEVENTRVGRFLRSMCKDDFLEVKQRGAPFNVYAVTPTALVFVQQLKREGRLPGVCSMCGKQGPTHVFCRRHFCRDCMMDAHRSDFC